MLIRTFYRTITLKKTYHPNHLPHFLSLHPTDQSAPAILIQVKGLREIHAIHSRKREQDNNLLLLLLFQTSKRSVRPVSYCKWLYGQNYYDMTFRNVKEESHYYNRIKCVQENAYLRYHTVKLLYQLDFLYFQLIGPWAHQRDLESQPSSFSSFLWDQMEQSKIMVK